MAATKTTISKISERTVTVAGLFFLVLFVCTHFFVDSSLLKIVFGFPLLVALPGFLFLQTIQPGKLFDWLYLCAAVGSSLTILMLFGLAINFVLPIMGLVPLVGDTLIFSFSSLIVLLSVVPIYRGELIRYRINSGGGSDYALIGLSLISLVLSVVGALRLNNQLGAEVTLFNLYLIGILFGLTLYFHKHIQEWVLCGIFYLQSLALLLMTSLRGWDIVGHDIQREFSVFQMTHSAGVWSIDYLLDAYNACMSITILPTILAELLTIPDVYIYKILYQVIFALVPVISFVVINRYFPKYVTIIATFLIISFPTFFTDMPMLNRQQIAFLMFMLLVSVLLDAKLSERVKNFLIVFFGIGIILSHYSTTYIVIIFLLTAWVGFWFLKVALSSPKIKIFKRLLKTYSLPNRSAISVFALIAIILLSYGWSNQFTQTSDDSIKRVLVRTYDALLKDSESSRSTDTLYSFFTVNKITPEEALRNYKTDYVEEIRSNAEEGTYYTESNIVNFNPVLAPEAVVPVTVLGEYLESFGVDVTSLNRVLKFETAKILQLFLLLGMLVSLFSVRYYVKKPPVEYLFLSIAGVLFLAAMVLIPVLSVEYGVLRAFQQSLFITAPFAVMGMLSVAMLFGEKFAKIFATCFVLLFFFASTGAATQTFGGYKPLLHLNNSGPYYDYYFLHDSEAKALQWLNDESEKSDDANFQTQIQTDRYVSKKINERTEARSRNEIFPSLTRKNSFVFLGYANVENGNATIYHNGTVLNFEYPIELIDEYKNKVYDSEGVIIYR